MAKAVLGDECLGSETFIVKQEGPWSEPEGAGRTELRGVVGSAPAEPRRWASWAPCVRLSVQSSLARRPGGQRAQRRLIPAARFSPQIANTEAGNEEAPERINTSKARF